VLDYLTAINFFQSDPEFITFRIADSQRHSLAIVQARCDVPLNCKPVFSVVEYRWKSDHGAFSSGEEKKLTHALHERLSQLDPGLDPWMKITDLGLEYGS
jgi:hypothetical protein